MYIGLNVYSLMFLSISICALSFIKFKLVFLNYHYMQKSKEKNVRLQKTTLHVNSKLHISKFIKAKNS